MLRSPLLPIFLTVFVDVLGLTLMLPLMPFYAEHFGATPLVVGTLTATYAVCQLVSGPILGRLSDRVGRKPILLVSQMGTFAAFLTIGWAGSLWMLFLGRIFDGLTAGNLTIAQAYISDVTRPENRTKAFALIGIAFGMGFLLGPGISGFMAHRYGFAAPAFVAAGLSFTSIVFTATLLPGVKPPAEEHGRRSKAPSFRDLLDRPAPRRRLLEFFAFTLSFSTLVGGLAMFLEREMGFDVQKTAYVFIFSGFVGALVQGGLIGRLAKRYGEEKLSLAGFLAMAIGYAFLGTLGASFVGPALKLPMLLAMVAVSGFGVAVTRPSLTTLLTKSVGRHETGAVLGSSQSLASVAQIVGPISAGFLIGKNQLAVYGLVAGMFAAVGVLLRLQPEPPLTADAERPASGR